MIVRVRFRGGVSRFVRMEMLLLQFAAVTPLFQGSVYTLSASAVASHCTLKVRQIFTVSCCSGLANGAERAGRGGRGNESNRYVFRRRRLTAKKALYCRSEINVAVSAMNASCRDFPRCEKCWCFCKSLAFF